MSRIEERGKRPLAARSLVSLDQWQESPNSSLNTRALSFPGEDKQARPQTARTSSGRESLIRRPSFTSDKPAVVRYPSGNNGSTKLSDSVSSFTGDRKEYIRSQSATHLSRPSSAPLNGLNKSTKAPPLSSKSPRSSSPKGPRSSTPTSPKNASSMPVGRTNSSNSRLAQQSRYAGYDAPLKSCSSASYSDANEPIAIQLPADTSPQFLQICREGLRAGIDSFESLFVAVNNSNCTPSNSGPDSNLGFAGSVVVQCLDMVQTVDPFGIAPAVTKLLRAVLERFTAVEECKSMANRLSERMELLLPFLEDVNEGLRSSPRSARQVIPCLHHIYRFLADSAQVVKDWDDAGASKIKKMWRWCRSQEWQKRITNAE